MKSRNCGCKSFEFLCVPHQSGSSARPLWHSTPGRSAPVGMERRLVGMRYVTGRCGTKHSASTPTVWHLTWSVKGMNILGKRRGLSLFKQLVRIINQLSVCCKDFLSVLYSAWLFDVIFVPYVDVWDFRKWTIWCILFGVACFYVQSMFK